ncbi:LOW QUALITY PROTEIN: hypothetical protein BC936DRAFT_137949 [Jimgerdemannia flammicorona]|uniref:Uncharacterized protein n=1 Tax=Jimgerdemannia flammicorona TaxID=994334 RepID=A0A433DMW6_9FUNG|nr:LOW QUALITY PROTEIN: hypothetical protein BC936DRAFT_137949 [Jimgerdemannia flammicorona]
MTSLSATEYIRKNLHDIDFFMFSKHFKAFQIRTERELAMRHYIGNMAMLGSDTDKEIKRLAKRKKDAAQKLTRGQLNDFWISVEAELAEDHFAKNIAAFKSVRAALYGTNIDNPQPCLLMASFHCCSLRTRSLMRKNIIVSSDSMPSTPSKRLSSSEVPLPTSDSKKPRINNLDVSFDDFIDSSSSEKGETATTLVSESSEDELTIAVNEGDIDDSLFVAIESMIDKVRRRPSGTLSPMFYCVLDLRPPSLLGSYEIRAVDFLSEDHLKTVMEQAEVARSKLFDPPEAACKLLHVLQQVSTAALVDLCGQMRIEGAAGLLKRLATLDAKVFVPRPASLEELLGGSEHGNDAMKTTAEDLKDVSTEEEVQWIFHVLDEIGEGESRASRNRRNDIEDKRCIGDKFDWLISCYSSYPDDIRGIELGIGENSGPTHIDGTEKVSTDFVKVVKTARDQLSQIIRIVQNEYGSDRLSESLGRGIKALFIVALHVVGFRVQVHVVYRIGGNAFAVSELGCSRFPHSLESIHEALDMCHLILRTKALVSRTIKLVDALLLEARRSRKLPTAAVTIAQDQRIISEVKTPVKVRKLTKTTRC